MHPTSEQPRLLARLRMALRLRHYSRRTEEAYVAWVRRFVRYSGLRHPASLGTADIERFLSHLAVRARVSASTQNQALAALAFLYRDVLGDERPFVEKVVRAKRPLRLPVVLTRGEVGAVLGGMNGQPRLVASLLYGGGLRLLEGVQLRVKDVDFGLGQLLVRGGKGDKDRVTVLPAALQSPLQSHLERVRRLHFRDLARGAGRVVLPDALERKYPSASREWGWQYVFPAARRYRDAATGELRRHHLHESAVLSDGQRWPRRRQPADGAPPGAAHRLRGAARRHRPLVPEPWSQRAVVRHAHGLTGR